MLPPHIRESISIFANDGAGGFEDPYSYSVGAAPTVLAADDLNGDNYPDIVTGNSLATVSVLMNQGDDSIIRI